MNNMIRKLSMSAVIVMLIAMTYCNAVVDNLNKALSSPRPPHGLTPSSPLTEFQKHGYKGCRYDNWCYIDDEGERHYCMDCPEYIIQDGCIGECCRKNRGVQEGKFQCATTVRDAKPPECPKIEIPGSEITCHPNNHIMWIQTECRIQCLNLTVHKYIICKRKGSRLQWVPELSQDLCKVDETTAIDTTPTTTSVETTTSAEIEPSHTLYDIVNASDKMSNNSQSTGTIDEAVKKYIVPVVLGGTGVVVFIGLLCFCLIRKRLKDPKWKPLKNRFTGYKPKEENPDNDLDLKDTEEVPLYGLDEDEEKPKGAVRRDGIKTENSGKISCEKQDSENIPQSNTPLAEGPPTSDDNTYSLSLNFRPIKKDDHPVKIMPEPSAGENTFEFIESKPESEELEALIGPKDPPKKLSSSANDSASPMPQISPAGLSPMDSELFKFPKDGNPHAGGEPIVGAIDEPKSDGNMKATPELCPSPSFDSGGPRIQAPGGYIANSDSMGINFVPVREEQKPRNYGGARTKCEEARNEDPNKQLKEWVKNLPGVLLDDMWQDFDFQTLLRVELDPDDAWTVLERECPVLPLNVQKRICSMNKYIIHASHVGKQSNQSCTINTINGILERNPAVKIKELLIWIIKVGRFDVVSNIKKFMEKHGYSTNHRLSKL